MGIVCAELSVDGQRAEVNLIAGGGGVVGSRCAGFAALPHVVANCLRQGDRYKFVTLPKEFAAQRNHAQRNSVTSL